MTPPAIGLLEHPSIATGIRLGDAMVKRAPVSLLHAGTVHPGKYLLLVAGDVASVEEALIAADDAIHPDDAPFLDRLFLPDVEPRVAAAVRGARDNTGDGEALGVFETATVAATVAAADRVLKGTAVSLREIRLADHLGGKAYALFQGPVAEVEIALDIATDGLRKPGLLVGRALIAQLHDDLRDNLDDGGSFMPRLQAST